MGYKVNEDNTYIKNKYVLENCFIGKEAENKELPKYENESNNLPKPFWNGHEDTIRCYDKSWEIAFTNMKKPTKENGFINNYIDASFNGCMFMWDSVFMLMFGKYANRVFNFQNTLNNMYSKQHKDGFISREIIEENGNDKFHRMDPVSTGPNILAWSEWEYYMTFGDTDRIHQVFPVLMAYHQWMKEYRTWQDGSYWSTGWGCGMDNSPRLENGYDVQFSNGHQIWVDANMQAMLNIKILIKMAKICGRNDDIIVLEKEKQLLADIINNKLWDDETSFYYDLWIGNRQNKIKTVASFWALLADVVPENKKDKFISHLCNENEFKRKHMVPTLSADEKGYLGNGGGYWKGGVWSPTNYMILKGLRQYGYEKLAHDIALNHILNITQVFNETNTVWENYSPDTIQRGNQSKSNFVGWTGVSTIAIFIEFVLGIESEYNENKIIWNVNLLEEHGIKNYLFGRNNMIELRCSKRNSIEEEPEISVQADCDLCVEVVWSGKKKYINVKKDCNGTV